MPPEPEAPGNARRRLLVLILRFLLGLLAAEAVGYLIDGRLRADDSDAPRS